MAFSDLQKWELNDKIYWPQNMKNHGKIKLKNIYLSENIILY